MVRQRLRRPFWARFLRVKCTHFIILLTLGCISSFITFSLTLYVTSNYLVDLISYILVSESNDMQLQYRLPGIGENYRPRDFSGKMNSIRYDYHLKYKDFDYRKPETLTYKSRTYSNDIEILFRFPQKTSVFALLLIFHACKHSASEWFHTTERQRIIGAAVDLGYACLVFQATDKNSQCWSNDADIYSNKDVQMVFKGLEGFYKEHPELVSLPRFTFGSSSGGIFSSIFVINPLYEIQGQILFISIIPPEILYTYVKPKNYPPTAWIHMLRDIEFASEDRINISQQIFNEYKIPQRNFPIEPVAIIHSTFHDRIPSVTTETSSYIVYRLQQNRWLNSHNFLMYNPRRKLAWQTFLFPSSISEGGTKEVLDNLNKNKEIISEFLNTVYGEHEISYERSSEALDWLKQTYLLSKNLTNQKN